MRCIAVINQKGGVGKTTVTVNLGSALARLGFKVTLIDLDPQGHLAASLGVFRPPELGLDKVMLKGIGLKEPLIKINNRLSLIPAGRALDQVEQISNGGSKRAMILKNAMDAADLTDDFYLLDCPPSFGLLLSNAIMAVDEALIPATGDYLGLNGLAQLVGTIKKFEPYRGRVLPMWLVMSRFQQRRRLSQEVLSKLLQYFPNRILATPIREMVALAEAPGTGKDIFEYRPKSLSAADFSALADDLIEGRTRDV